MNGCNVIDETVPVNKPRTCVLPVPCLPECLPDHEGAAFLRAHPLSFVPDDALARSKHPRDQCCRGLPVTGGDHADDAIVHVAVAATDYVPAVDSA